MNGEKKKKNLFSSIKSLWLLKNEDKLDEKLKVR